ncbi:hypothetical protein ACLB2K_025413 [Fragaria x ananassa]
MASSQSTQDMGSVPPMEQIFQMLMELKQSGAEQSLATQQSIANLTEQVSTTQQIVANLNEQSKQDRILWMASHNKLTDPAKQIELPSSQSSDEAFPLDEPTSKEETVLSIHDKKPKVEVGGIMDNKSISHGVPQKNEPEYRTEQSILEA